MDKKRIIELLNIGENREIEFKEATKKLPKSLWETYSSFANTKGGFIILGVKENKETKICSIEGIENVNNILKDFWNTINNSEKISCNIIDDDYVEVTEIEGKKIIIINIPSANRKNKPIFINNNPLTGTFKRFHEGDYKCNKEEVRKMLIESSTESKDRVALEEFDINSLNMESVKDYRKLFKVHKGDLNKWNSLSDEEFLYNINALDRDTKKVTLAGLLMFGSEEDIIKILPNYFLDYREVKEDTVEKWSYRITSWEDSWSGNLWDFFEKIVSRLTADIEVPYALDKNLMTIEDTDIHKSIREALTNSLVHFQLDETGSILVEKRPNYYKFANPGLMRVSIKDAFKGGQSDPRNPILHRMFSLLGFGERAGSGLSLIDTTWKENGWIAPSIEEGHNPDRTTLVLITQKENDYTKNYAKNYTKNYPNNYTKNYANVLNETQIAIIELMSENPKITAKQISQKIENLSIPGVKWNLDQLKSKGIIERKGTPRGGYWIIK